MKGMILAAGLGSRLHPLTLALPKCLVEVRRKPILINALEHLEAFGLRETVLVVGYLAGQVWKTVGERFGQMAIRYVENPRFRESGSAYSLSVGLSALTPGEDLLLLEGDVFFEQRLLRRFLESGLDTATIVERQRAGLRGTLVTVGDDGAVTRWERQEVQAPGSPLGAKCKTVNISRLGSGFIAEHLVQALHALVGTGEEGISVEEVLDRIVRGTKARVDAFETGGLLWVEIDDLDDLRWAEEVFGAPPKKSCVESSAT